MYLMLFCFMYRIMDATYRYMSLKHFCLSCGMRFIHVFLKNSSFSCGMRYIYLKHFCFSCGMRVLKRTESARNCVCSSGM